MPHRLLPPQVRVKVYIRAPLPATTPLAAAPVPVDAEAAAPALAVLPSAAGTAAAEAAAAAPSTAVSSSAATAPVVDARAAPSEYLALTSVPLLGRGAPEVAPPSLTANAAVAPAVSAPPTSSAAQGWRWRECGVGPLRLNVRLDAVPPGTQSVSLAVSATSSAGSAATLATLGPRAGAYAPPPEGGASASPPPLSGPAARLVIRQEHHKGGPGKRLLVNAPLWPGVPIARHPADERALQVRRRCSVVAGQKKSGPVLAPSLPPS